MIPNENDVCFGLKKMFWAQTVAMHAHLWDYTKNHRAVHFKKVNLWDANYTSDL